MWILMKTAVEKGVSKMQVLGDSNILMDWANGCCQISNLAFNHGEILGGKKPF